MTLFDNNDTHTECFRKTDLYKSLPIRKKLQYRWLRWRSKWIWSKFYWSHGRRADALRFLVTGH